MRGATPPLPQYAFMAWCSVKKKHRDNFSFTLPYLQVREDIGETWQHGRVQAVPINISATGIIARRLRKSESNENRSTVVQKSIILDTTSSERKPSNCK